MSTLPLTGAQRGVVNAQLLDPHSPYYVVGEVLDITNADIDIAALSRSLVAVQEDFETLRVRLVEGDGGEPRQYVGDVACPSIEVVDVRPHPDPVASAHCLVDALRGHFAEDARYLFERPLCAYSIIRLVDRVWVVQLYHHVIIDGYAAALTSRRVQEHYNHLVAEVPLAPLKAVPMADVVALDQAYESSEQRERDAAFWREELAKFPAAARRADMNAATGAAEASGMTWTTSVPVSKEAFDVLREQSRGEGLSWVEVIFGLVTGWMRRFSDEFFDAGEEQCDVVVAMPVMARHDLALKLTPAMAVNVVPVRTGVALSDSLVGIAQRVAARFRDIMPHAQFRGELLPSLDSGADVAHYLHGVGVNTKIFDRPLSFDGAPGRLRNIAGGPPEDFGFVVSPAADGGLVLGLETDPQRVNPDMARARLESLAAFIDHFVADPHARLGDVAALPPSTLDAEHSHCELGAVLDSRVGRVPAAGEDGLETFVARVLAGQVGDIVWHPAFKGVDSVPACGATRQQAGWRLRGADLAAIVRQVAAGMSHLCPRGHVMVLDMPRGLDVVCALLGSLVAGRCFVVLDPDAPHARRESILSDVGDDRVVVSCLEDILVHGGPSDRLYDGGTHDADDVAYLVYTSGSTGQPKGVCVSRQNLDALLRAHSGGLYRRPHSVVAHTAPLTFDAAIDQLLWLSAGHDAHLYTVGTADGAEVLVEAFRRDGVNVVDGTPSLLSVLVEAGLLRVPTVRVIISGGEAIPQRLWDALTTEHTPGLEAYNVYGPSEATVDALCAAVTAGPATIGWPLSTVDAYVVDQHMRVLPDGVKGQLVLAGPQVASGYRGIGAKDPRAEAFAWRTLDPRKGPQWSYATGDVVRFIPGRGYEFVGREDHQAQLAGQRVELEEITHAVLRAPGVRRAATVVHQSVPVTVFQADEGCDEEAVLAVCREFLPTGWVPQLCLVDAVPVLDSGKVDWPGVRECAGRHLLGRRGTAGSRPVAADDHHAAEVLTDVVAEVLNIAEADVDLERSLQQQGGDSIAALTIATRCRRRGVVFPPRALLGGARLGDAARDAALEHTSDGAGLPETSPGSTTGPDVAFGVVHPGMVAATQFAVSGDRRAFACFVFVEEVSHPPIDIADAVDAATQLMDTVDALRMVVSTDPTIAQLFGSSMPGPLRVMVPRQPVVAGERIVRSSTSVGELVAGVDPEAGVMWQVGVSEEGLSTLVVHHMACDAVSWPLLRQMWVSALRGVRPIPPDSVSLRAEYARRERAFDQVQVSPPPRLVQIQDAVHVRTPLGETAAGALADLGHGDEFFRASVTDAIVAAVIAAVAEVVPEALKDTEVALEAHGRDSLSATTIGWLTSELTLGALDELSAAGTQPTGAHRLAEIIANVRHARQASTKVSSRPRRVVINVLPPDDGGGFRVSMPPAHRLSESLTVNVFLKKQPEAEIVADPGFLSQEQLPEYLEYFGQALACVVAARQLGVGCSIPADFPTCSLTLAQVRAAEARGALAELYPATPAQQGLVFHSLAAEDGGDAYVVAVGVRLKGRIEPSAMRSALRAVAKRHSLLRARIAVRDLPVPHLVVPAHSPDVGEELHVVDVRHLSESSAHAVTRELLAAEFARHIDVEAAAPMRAHLVLLPGGADAELILSTHHLFTDGWSSGVLLRDLIDCYSAAVVGENTTPSTGGSFERYVSYIQAEGVRERALAVWRELLPTCDAVPLVAECAPPTPGEHHPQGETSCVVAHLDGDVVRAAALRWGTTPSTLVQASWALAVHAALGLEGDTPVGFGVTVNGRPAEVAGVEDTIGMFINTVPVHLGGELCAPTAEVAGLVSALDAAARRRASAEHISAHELAELCGPRPLFDSAVVFENYPQPPLRDDVVELVGVRSSGQTHYPITVVCPPGEDFTIVVAHRPAAIDPDFVRCVGENLRAIFLSLCSGQPRTIGEVCAGTHRFPGVRPHGARRNPPQEQKNHLLASERVEQRQDHPAGGVGIVVDEVKRVLRIPAASESDNFFALGGSSLTAVALLAALHKRGMSVQMRDILDAHTLREIASTAGTVREEDSARVVTISAGSDSATPVWCIHPVTGSAMPFQPLREAGMDAPVYALELGSPCHGIRTVEQLAAEYVRLLSQRQPHGPYRLMGYSLGARIAHHMASQLQQRGDDVEFFAILDGYPAGASRAPAPVGDLHRRHPHYCAVMDFLLGLEDSAPARPYAGDAVVVWADNPEPDAGPVTPWDPVAAWENCPGIRSVRARRVPVDHDALVSHTTWGMYLPFLNDFLHNAQSNHAQKGSARA